MNTNENVTTNVEEVTEVIENSGMSTGMKVALGLGGLTLLGFGARKLFNHFKAKQCYELELEDEDLDDDFVDEDIENEEDEEPETEEN